MDENPLRLRLFVAWANLKPRNHWSKKVKSKTQNVKSVALDIRVYSTRVDNKTNTDPTAQFDEIDLQIIKLRTDNPRISTREIAKHVKLSHVSVWKRILKIGESDYVKLCRADLARMLPVAQRAYLRSLTNPDKQLEAAKSLLQGLGVFTNRNEVSGPDGKPIQVSGRVVLLPDDGSSPKTPDDTSGS